MLWQFAGAGYEPELVLVRIFLQHAKTLDPRSPDQQDKLDLVAARMMHYARLYELRYKKCCPELIAELEPVADHVRPTETLSHWTDHCLRVVRDPSAATDQEGWSILNTRPKTERLSGGLEFHGSYQPNQVHTQKSIRLHRKRNLLAYAVEFDLLLFVQTWLQLHSSDIQKPGGAPLLYHALSPVLPGELLGRPPQVNRDMVEVLLKAGANPNQKVRSWGNDTVWEMTIRSVLSRSLRRSKGDADTATTPPPKRDSRFVKQDDYHIRQLFSPLCEWLENAENGKPQSAAVSRAEVEGNIEILELMLHHDADHSIVRRSELRRMLPRLCGRCQAILREESFDNSPTRDGLPMHYKPSGRKAQATLVEMFYSPHDGASNAENTAPDSGVTASDSDDTASSSGDGHALFLTSPYPKMGTHIDAIAAVRGDENSRRPGRQASRVDSRLTQCCSTDT